MEKQILVIDINYLTEDYKALEISIAKTKLETEYNCKILLIDSSKQNVLGSNLNQPVYFTK